MVKTLVVYYSRTGITKKVALALADILGADREEIISEKNRAGVIGYLLSGKEAYKRQLAKDLGPTAKNPADYDLVIIGTPIWSFTLSSPVRTFLEGNNGKFKRVAVFCTMGRRCDNRAFAEMEKIIGSSSVARLALTTKEVVANNFLEKLNSFVKQLK